MSSSLVAAQDQASSRGRAIAFGFTSLVRAWLQRREHRIAIVKLNAMSDRELRDVGLERDQIQTAVTRGRASVEHGPLFI
jgi:uncharacterized protein YjiS (DUF1127 family)